MAFIFEPLNAMTKLSVTVITFNEEKKIGRCLQSLKEVADEIVVIDSLSTDATKEICLSHKVVFIENPFPGYIEQKNFALSKASHPNVLSLDADEALSDELIKSIRTEKEKGFPCDGYTMNRFNFYCGRWVRHGTYYPDRKLRLLNTVKGKWGGQNPHDRILMQEGAAIKQLKGDLLHYTYQSIEEHNKQTDRFSSIAAKALFDKGKQPSYGKLIFHPAWAFIKGYIIKLGFMDGFAGYMIARFTAIQSFLKYAKLIRLHNEARQSNEGRV
ncbi:MAG: glycosyltransferase family 2 protein [Chitinophagaceae bacterium]